MGASFCDIINGSECICKHYGNKEFPPIWPIVFFQYIVAIIKKTPLRNENSPITDPIITEMGVTYTSGSLHFIEIELVHFPFNELFTEKLSKKQQLDKASVESHRQMSRH
jgi:hypothetical protein